MFFFKADIWSKLVLGMVPLGAIAFHVAPAFAQASIPGATTICAYNPDSGLPNPLGMRSFITVAQVGDDTVFVYERFSSPVQNENDSDITTDISSRRTLTIYAIPLEEARQVLVDSSDSYRVLLGLQDDASADVDFASVNSTLACQNVADDVASAPIPTPETPAAGPPTEMPIPSSAVPQPAQSTLEDLPNGNYRVTSATYPLSVVSDEELVENGGALFLFRKFGEDVTGLFSYIDSDVGACVAGTLEGNTVSGQAYTDDGFSPEESTAVFLGPGGFLLLGESDGEPLRTGARSYNDAELNLEGFSRINAGTVLPPESCP